MTLFDSNHWAHVIVLCVTAQFLLCSILNLRAISEYKPPGACIWRGDLSEGFCVTSLGGGGLIFGGAYFPNFTVYGSNQSTYECCVYNAQLLLKTPTACMHTSFID